MKKRVFGAPSIPAPENSDSEQEFQPTYVRNNRSDNLYSALLEDSGAGASEEDGSDRDRDSSDCAPPPLPLHNKNRRKKKKKKQNKHPEEDVETQCGDADVAELARGVAELTAPASPAVQRATPPQVLRIDPRKLNVVNEIRKNYQVDVVKEFDNPPDRKRGAWFRKTTFVYPKKGWKAIRNTDLSMKLVKTDADGVAYFTFVHGASYRATQIAFFYITHKDDRLSLEHLLHTNPLHIDSLLLIAHVDGMLKHYAESKEHIEFAIFIMEHVFHKQFDYASGMCRLLYRHFENRALHIALLKLVRYHYNLACHRTALELCKLLLALDPSDPLGVTLLADAVALRAEQYEWLIQAIEYWDAQHRALSLPNMGYAYALAHFMLASKPECGEKSARASELLRAAVRRWPSCALHVLDKCGSLRARAVRDLPLFHPQTEETNGPVLWCLSRLVAERQFPVWKRPAVLAWLERECEDAGATREASDAARGRRAVYRRAPLPLLRNLTVLNHSRVAPPDSDMNVQAFPVTDPYPPPDTISPYLTSANPYSSASRRQHQPFNPLQFMGL